MAIIIKRFGVKHKGIRYGPGLPGGSILYGLTEEEEERLIAESNGTIEKYEEEKPAEEGKSTDLYVEEQEAAPKSKAKKKRR